MPVKEKTVQDVKEKTEEKEETEPEVLFPPPKMTKAQMQKARVLGFDMEGLVQGIQRVNLWAETVEQRFVIMQKEMPQQTAKALMKIADQRKQEQIKQFQQSGQQPQRGDNPDTAQMLLQAVMGGAGGQSNPQFQKWQDEMMQLQLENMRKRNRSEDIGNAFTKALIIKLVPAMADEVLKSS